MGDYTTNERTVAMSKPYRKLRAKLVEYDIDQEYLCEILGRGITYVSHRMNAKKAWTQEEMYTMMDELEIPYEMMHEYFPNYQRVEIKSGEKRNLRIVGVG